MEHTFKEKKKYIIYLKRSRQVKTFVNSCLGFPFAGICLYFLWRYHLSFNHKATRLFGGRIDRSGSQTLAWW